MITTTEDLKAACLHLANAPFVTVDTEFIRESTFWPELCLIQCATPKDNGGDAYIIDPLSGSIDLAPFFELMADVNVVKVFHAARQDIEIVYKLGNLIPHPVFDTQVAAMVCGYGDSISYDQLVFKVTGAQVDKSSRFTDWRRRPLTEKQLDYAIADVTHLRTVYQKLKANLEEQGRTNWVSEEMDTLTSPDTYEMLPENAWKRLKLRVRKPRELLMLMELARWRELEAQANNMPRGRIIKDEAIYELAGNPPGELADLDRFRGLSRGFDRNRWGEALVALSGKVLAVAKDSLPKLPRPKHAPEGCSAATEMLKLLLKLTAEKEGVAAKVIATVDELEKIAADDDADVLALKGWRRDVFGQQALKLKHGKLAISYRDRKIVMVDLDRAADLAQAAE
ncbi:MAG: ribonuclease D [Nitratireductor sp.]|nr:ribonuclease D [Nitratireductor sp.]